MGESVHDRVCDGRLPNCRVPLGYRQLSGDDCSETLVPVIEDLKERKSVIGFKRSESEIIDDQKRGLGESGDLFEIGAIATGRTEHRKESGRAQIAGCDPFETGFGGEGACEEALAVMESFP